MVNNVTSKVGRLNGSRAAAAKPRRVQARRLGSASSPARRSAIPVSRKPISEYVSSAFKFFKKNMKLVKLANLVVGLKSLKVEAKDNYEDSADKKFPVSPKKEINISSLNEMFSEVDIGEKTEDIAMDIDEKDLLDFFFEDLNLSSFQPPVNDKKFPVSPKKEINISSLNEMFSEVDIGEKTEDIAMDIDEKDLLDFFFEDLNLPSFQPPANEKKF